MNSSRIEGTSVATRGFLALFAVVIGWLIASAIFAVWLYAVQSSFADFGPVLFWTAIYAFLGWLLCFLPVVAFIPETSSTFSPRLPPWVGAVIGFLTFFFLIGRFGLWASPPYSSRAIITGWVAGLAYAVGLPGYRDWRERSFEHAPWRQRGA